MTRRLLALLASVAVVLLVTAVPALAHVEVSPKEAARGATTTFTFSVPNESETAKTVKVEIFIPDDAGLANPAPVPGWTASATKSSVTWQGGSISGDDEVEFAVAVGPLPNGDSIVFKALQTYDNGDVVRWIDATPASGDEPEHPAPVVTLTGPAVATPTTTVEATSITTTPGNDNGDDDSDDNNAGIIIAVVAGLVVLAGAAVALNARRTRSEGS